MDTVERKLKDECRTWNGMHGILASSVKVENERWKIHSMRRMDNQKTEK